MTESAAEKIIRLANAGEATSLDRILQLAGAVVSNGMDSSDVEDPASEAAEANDNEKMMHAGVSMNAVGHATYGSVVLGHVRPHKAGGYVGVHPSGLVTSKVPTRAKAAMALLNLHQYVPKDTKNQVKHVTLSGNPLDQVLSLAGNAPGNGKKPYGNVTYADPKNGKYPIDNEAHVRAAWAYISKPKNASVYPLNGVTLNSVKSRIKAAAAKLGIEIADDSK